MSRYEEQEEEEGEEREMKENFILKYMNFLRRHDTFIWQSFVGAQK